MAKRRHGNAEEMLLVPFLDILCSLIGVLILIIVVLVVAQSQQTNGRTKEEIDRAVAFKAMLVKKKKLDEVQKDTTDKLSLLNKDKKDQEEKEERAARLRKLLGSTGDIQKTNKEMSQNLLKELDNLMLEIDGHKKQQAEFSKEIAEANKEILRRKLARDKIPEVPPVVVQPGGSGTDKNSKLYFVEAGGGKIVIYWDQNKRTQIGATPEIIIADKSYEAFLTALKGNQNAKLVFLIRSDGLGAYNNAAGWAQETYKFGVSQVGRLPIPGVGAIDLSEFKELMGSVTPPEGTPFMPPPGQAPAAAPKAATPAPPAASTPPASKVQPSTAAPAAPKA